MKLYYSAGSCSTSCHITLEESGLAHEAIGIDWDDANDPNIPVVQKLNPLGTLPILITDDGKQLDQNLAIHTYVADRAVNPLLPPPGTFERAQALNWLSFVCSDLHKSIGGLFGIERVSPDKAIQAAYRKYMVEQSNHYLKYMNTKLDGRDYLMGTTFTPADAYAFVVTGWTKWLDVPLAPFPNIERYLERVAARPAVAKVLKVEELT